MKVSSKLRRIGKALLAGCIVSNIISPSAVAVRINPGIYNGVGFSNAELADLAGMGSRFMNCQFYDCSMSVNFDYNQTTSYSNCTFNNCNAGYINSIINGWADTGAQPAHYSGSGNIAKKCSFGVWGFSRNGGAYPLKFSGFSAHSGIFAAGNGVTVGSNSKVSSSYQVDYGGTVIAFNNVDPLPDTRPPNLEVSRNPSSSSTPVTSVQLTCTASDPEGNNSVSPISISTQNGYYPSGSTFTITENQTVTVNARDSNNNTTTKTIVINNIDSQPPSINNLTASNTAWTRANVTVTCVATDDATPVGSLKYAFDFKNYETGRTITGGFGSSKNYSVSAPGEVRVRVQDAVNHVSTSDWLIVTNIDKKAPEVTLSVDTEELVGTDVGVVITAEAIDPEAPVTLDSSGLADSPYSWNGKGYSNNASFVAKENGTYQVTAKDRAGNVSIPASITISNISTSKPVIDSVIWSGADSEYVGPDETITVIAHAVDGKTLPTQCYSWDGGATWTSQNTFNPSRNGEYSVIVKDSVGNMSEEHKVTISNVDNVAPSLNMYAKKGPPEEDPDADESDYVWKLTIYADDSYSGFDSFTTDWDGEKFTESPQTFDITATGVYSVTVTDKAGNKTSAEKTLICEPNSNTVTSITIDPSITLVDSELGVNFTDLVYGPAGVYNKVKKVTLPYTDPSNPSINITASLDRKSGKTITGSVSFNGRTYTFTDGGTAGNKAKLNCKIPISDITSDISNGRADIKFTEKKDSNGSITREGSTSFRTSVQVSPPSLAYNYDKVTERLTLSGYSSVAGISGINMGSPIDLMYTSPIDIGSYSGEMNVVVRDNCGTEVSKILNLTDIIASGSGGNSGSIGTSSIGNRKLNVVYVPSADSEIYIIGGTRSNTDVVPDNSVFDIFASVNLPIDSG